MAFTIMRGEWGDDKKKNRGLIAVIRERDPVKFLQVYCWWRNGKWLCQEFGLLRLLTEACEAPTRETGRRA